MSGHRVAALAEVIGVIAEGAGWHDRADGMTADKTAGRGSAQVIMR